MDEPRGRWSSEVHEADDPSISEPLFRGAKAKIELLPVMNRDDLRKGIQQIVGATQQTADASGG